MMDPIPSQPAKIYACRVEDVYSGDDLIAMVDLGVENLFKQQRIRLSGVDTPNAVHAGAGTEAGRVRQQVRDMVRGRAAQITLVSRAGNSWVVELTVETQQGTVSVNEFLRGAGYVYNKATA